MSTKLDPWGTPAGRPLPRGPFLHVVRRLWSFRREALAQCQELYDRHGAVVLHRAGPLDTVDLFGPDANRFVMMDRAGRFSARGAWDLIMGRIFRNGLLLRDGEDHRHHRRILQDAFRKSALERYAELMNPRIAQGLDGWRGRDRIHAFVAFKDLTLDLAATVFLGIELGEDAERIRRAFEDAVAASMSVLRLPIPGTEFQRGLAGRATMVRFFSAGMPARRASAGADVWSRLCQAEGEDGERLSDPEIVDHLIFLLMAAHDTTTSTLTSLVYELARNPDWQERIREESRGLGCEALAFEDLGRVPSIALAMSETLRRYPPLSTVPRMTREEVEFQGYRIPAGALVAVYPIHTHHMVAWWDEPFLWDPERFAEPRLEHRRHSHSYVPFGAGEHVCLGLRFAEMQVRAILHQLVQRYRWSVPAGYEMPVQQAPISKPLDGLPLEIRPL